MALFQVLTSGSRMASKRLTNNRRVQSLLYRSFISTSRVQEEAAAAEKTFQWEKAGELYEEMIRLDKEEFQLLTEVVNQKLGSIITEADMERMANPSSSASSESEDEPKEEAKTAFDLKLTGFDAKAKIKVIKEIRAITSLGLKEAKAMVDEAPKVIKSGIKMEEAEELKKKLEDIGATIEIA